MGVFPLEDVTGPRLSLPRDFNAATWFIDRHPAEGRGTKAAFVDRDGWLSFAGLAERVNRAGNALTGLGLHMEQRVALILPDTVDFPVMFWGAVKAGLVPIPMNTLLPATDYAYMLADSRARALIADPAVIARLTPELSGLPHLRHVVAAGPDLRALLADADPDLAPAPTTADDVAFWLYTSGSTGEPKGVPHMHRSLMATATLFGRGVLELGADDVVFSAAKLFFAYGLGNAMTFPLDAGATTVLWSERATAAAVAAVLERHRPTVFCGVPTLYASMLADPATAPALAGHRLRLCLSAGEALPAELGRRWRDFAGIDIVDGLGSTELLHIFLANRPGEVRPGSSGKPVPGYEVRVVTEHGRDALPGELGELAVRGPSAGLTYWNQRDKAVRTFRGDWTHTGDRYMVDQDGFFHYCGRADDMLKVSGIWVSPFEVESALVGHPAVLEAAVVACADGDGLIKPKAFVVLAPGHRADPALAAQLKAFVKDRLAPHKYPRWVEFVPDLPKTVTGKIQRFRLRA